MKNKYIFIIIYLFCLLILLINIKSAPIYSDEITWMVRGKESVYSIIHGSFNYFKTTVNDCETKFTCLFFGYPLILISGIFQILFAGNGKFSLNIFSDIVASRLPVVLLNSLIPAFIYLISVRIFKNKVAAIFSSLLFIVNPVLTLFGSWVINDGLQTLFTLLSIYTYLIYEPKNKINLYPGLFAAFAFTSKPTGLLVFVAWFGFFLLSRNIKSFKYLVVNLIIFFILIQLLWPYSWYHPFLSIFEYIYKQYLFVNSNQLENYYFGVTSNNPHWSYYLFLIFTRLTELTIFGLMFGVIKIKKYIKPLFPLVIYVFAYLFLISSSSQKIDLRYALPIIPYLLIVSGYGIFMFINKFSLKFRSYVVAIVVILAIYPLFWMKSGHIYFNNFIGEARGAQNKVLVGWCTSTKEAFFYLNNINAKGSVFVAGCPSATPYYSSMEVNKDYKKAEYIIYETYYKYQHPDSAINDYLKNKAPIKEIIEKGIVLAFIFKN